jgi:hypothetical protein
LARFKQGTSVLRYRCDKGGVKESYKVNENRIPRIASCVFEEIVGFEPWIRPEYQG